MVQADKNRRLLLDRRQASQMRALPSGIPGAPPFEVQNPLSGFMPRIMTTAVDSPAGNDPAAFAQIARGFPSQALGPTFISYGPMLAEGDVVIEEWESLIYGANGTVYNNQYIWLLRFEGEDVVEMREYNDSHHAALIFGTLGNWPALAPPTEPRRRSRKGASIAPLPESEIETVFEIVDAFDLDPLMLADVVPAASPLSPATGDAKAVVRALRRARAAGDHAAVNALHAPGFRHFIAGERPFGWDHLPLEEIYAPLVQHLASPLHVRYGALLAEDGRVFEEMDAFARLDDGTVYNNWHAFVHEVRDGRIVQTREYTDTRHLWVVLGRWAAWGMTPVAPRSIPRRSNLQGIAMTTQTPTFFLDIERWQELPPTGR